MKFGEVTQIMDGYNIKLELVCILKIEGAGRFLKLQKGIKN